MYRSNILLDEHLTAKIADLGLSIQVPQHYGSKTLITVGPGQGLPGTPGYRPAEYNDSCYCDVYSYGVVSMVNRLTLPGPSLCILPYKLSNAVMFSLCNNCPYKSSFCQFWMQIKRSVIVQLCDCGGCTAYRWFLRLSLDWLPSLNSELTIIWLALF